MLSSLHSVLVVIVSFCSFLTLLVSTFVFFSTRTRKQSKGPGYFFPILMWILLYCLRLLLPSSSELIATAGGGLIYRTKSDRGEHRPLPSDLSPPRPAPERRLSPVSSPGHGRSPTPAPARARPGARKPRSSRWTLAAGCVATCERPREAEGVGACPPMQGPVRGSRGDAAVLCSGRFSLWPLPQKRTPKATRPYMRITSSIYIWSGDERRQRCVCSKLKKWPLPSCESSWSSD